MYLYSQTLQYCYTECKADASRWYFLIVILGVLFLFFYTMTLLKRSFTFLHGSVLDLCFFDCPGLILGLHTTVLLLHYSWMYRLYLKCVLLCREDVCREVLALSIFFNKEINDPPLLIVFLGNLSFICSYTHTQAIRCSTCIYYYNYYILLLRCYYYNYYSTENLSPHMHAVCDSRKMKMSKIRRCSVTFKCP